MPAAETKRHGRIADLTAASNPFRAAVRDSTEFAVCELSDPEAGIETTLAEAEELFRKFDARLPDTRKQHRVLLVQQASQDGEAAWGEFGKLSDEIAEAIDAERLAKWAIPSEQPKLWVGLLSAEHLESFVRKEIRIDSFFGNLHVKKVSAFDQVIADARKSQLEPPPEILTLGRALRNLLTESPADRKEFAAAVGHLLERTNYCIRLHPEESIARRMLVNGSGSLVFQCTNGSNYGISYREEPGVMRPRSFDLVPYQRQYSRSNKMTKGP